MVKWLVVEDALRDRKGHWLEYVSTFVRELRALGDEVEVLCDRKAQGFVMEQTGARPVLPDSIWHRMGDGAGALKRYLRVPGHAVATFLAMRKVFRGFNHEKTRKDTKGEKGGAGSRELGEEEDLTTDNTDGHGWGGAGPCLDKPSGAAFSNPFTSELARDAENSSLTRSASGHAGAAELPRTDSGELMAEGSKLVPSSATGKALDSRRWTLDSGEAPDWIFVPTVLVHHLLGWWLLLKTGSVPRESRVLLFFPNLPIRLDESGKAHWTSGPTTRLMAWLFAQLRGEVENGKLVLGVETHAMRRALEGLIRMSVVYLPHPVEAQGETRVERRESSKCENVFTTEDTEGTEDLESGLRLAGQAGASEPDSLTSKLADVPVSESLIRFADGPAEALDAGRSTLDTEASASPIVFGCYGAARWEKGSDIFQEAIKLILSNEVSSGECRVASVEDKAEPVTRDSLPATAAGRPLRFAIQWVEDFRDREGNLVSIGPLLREHPQVEVIGRYFEGDEYERCLAQTDVMVLPYRSPYRLRVSRVVIEAMLNGMPVIATCGTTLFEQAEEYGVVVGCDEGDAESLAGAMLEVAESFVMLRAEAEEQVNAAAESFSVGYFRELLWRLCRRELKSENG